VVRRRCRRAGLVAGLVLVVATLVGTGTPAAAGTSRPEVVPALPMAG
jgi:hypothetical protein